MFITKFHSRYKHLYLERSRSEEPVNLPATNTHTYRLFKFLKSRYY